MEMLFEKYVEQSLRRRFAPFGIRVQGQAREHFLPTGPHAFLLKPDLVLWHAGKRVGVLDTKWKLIDARIKYDIHEEDPTAGIKQSDMYQLFAYGHKYLGGKGRLMLIYPRSAGFAEPLKPFVLGDGLTLDVVPFDLATDACPMIDGDWQMS